MARLGPLRILIVDDHAVLRRGLREIVEEEFPGAQVGEAHNGPVALEHVRKGDWQAVVLDISLPGMSGLDVLKEIKNMRPGLAVLVLSMHPEEQYAVRVLKAGAAGYLTKETAPEELVEAIRKAVAGGKYVSASLAERLAAGLRTGFDGPPHEILSDREFEVLRRIGAGKTVSEIAEELALSVKTISTYRARVLEKMRMRTNAELMRYAMENQLGS